MPLTINNTNRHESPNTATHRPRERNGSSDAYPCIHIQNNTHTGRRASANYYARKTAASSAYTIISPSYILQHSTGTADKRYNATDAAAQGMEGREGRGWEWKGWRGGEREGGGDVMEVR